MLENLSSGAVRFKEEIFEEHKELFGELSKGQQPHTLFIGCSDSRVVPNLITHTKPGELFTIRNIANVVPPYREANEFLATTSAIEYALQILRVKNIIVCGHSNCGGCSALYAPKESFEKVPNVFHWLELLSSVKKQILKINPPSEAMRLWMTEQLNVKQQLNNLLTYPGVKERLKKGELNLQGWYYIIQSGEIFCYDLENQAFLPLNHQ
ncbi:carbonic anhydrase [Helicobacter monodelphidis]|uniref:carbonic anhydrase n=1 Tax=Helicobacter sp. 15-1451 TaxID=2004995 RepID=UPI000DCDD047|nr:carbonic anhydrase [Helicobacter sp. 15-1451]RAX59263.1 carbonic anhydrase [Helicobacter sp. 15-1451]